MEKFNMIQLLNKVETKVNSTMLSNIRKTEINLILLEIKKLAIDYTPCCTELKNKENLSFKEWKKDNKYEQAMHGYYKQEGNLVKSMDVVLMYKDYQDTL